MDGSAGTLALRQRSLALDFGEWSLFAARPGSPVGLRVGVFRAERVVTPLQNHIRQIGRRPPEGRPASPLLEARWTPGTPGMTLGPTETALSTSLLWSELRTAAEAGLLWIAKGARNETPTVITPAELEAGEPAGLRLPDAVVREVMAERYGRASESLAPSSEDWQAVIDSLDLCLTPNYRDGRTAARGQAVPDANSCAALRGLTVLAQVNSTAGGELVCIQRGIQRMTSDRAVHEPLDEEECIPLPPPGEASVELEHAVVGDTIRIEGGDLCLVLDNTPLDGDTVAGFRLDRSGLLEVRQGGGQSCTSAQAISRLRVAVYDPEREWHPVGLYRGASAEAMACPDVGACPWRVAAHDETDVFAYVRSRNRLAFRFATSPAVAAAVNRDPRHPVQVEERVPILAGVDGSFEGPRTPAMAAFVSRNPICPAEGDVTYADLRARRPPDVDSMLPGTSFYVHLLAVDGTTAPVHCLASAAFRVRDSRAVFATSAGPLGVELGVLGDTRLVFYFTAPLAAGASLSLLWFEIAPFPWLALDIAGNLTVGASWDEIPMLIDSTLVASRIGASLSIAAEIGIPDILPRLFSVGLMIHAAFDTHPSANGGDPVASGYVALNLSSLIDLAGGR